MNTSKMNTKAIFGFMVAAVLALFAMSSVLAVGDLPVSIDEISVNDVSSANGNIALAGYPEETVPVVVKFTANADINDLKVKVWIDDKSASTARFDVINGSTYIKRLALTLPSVDDMDSADEPFTLFVRLDDKTDYNEEEYSIVMQRDSYVLDFIYVDAPSRASAGEIVAVDVALENIGSRKSKNTVVTVSIPELGLSKRAFFDDLYAEDNSGDDESDARSGRLYLVIPADTKTGDYTLEVKAVNSDTTATSRKVMSITGLVVTNTNGSAITPEAGDNDGDLPTSIIVLTVVLVIIFVVLLVVLIVLLTKKPADRSEDFGETSYY